MPTMMYPYRVLSKSLTASHPERHWQKLFTFSPPHVSLYVRTLLLHEKSYMLLRHICLSDRLMCRTTPLRHMREEKYSVLVCVYSRAYNSTQYNARSTTARSTTARSTTALVYTPHALQNVTMSEVCFLHSVTCTCITYLPCWLWCSPACLRREIR